MEQLTQKYRPKVFSEVFGHSKVIQELKARAKDKNFPQAMYFTSNTGLGKTTLARIIAKTLTCLNPDENGIPCSECRFCKDVDEERFQLACFEYNASNMGIDEMRELEEKASLKTLHSSIKVFFVDELQELGGQGGSRKAQKNLLKILEKKQKNSFFILGSMDDSKVDPAIKNRCVTYYLHNLEIEEIAKCLFSICKKENIELSQDRTDILFTIAKSSQGSLRAAIGYLERCIYSELWHNDDLLKELNIVSEDSLIEITAKLLQGEPSVLGIPLKEDVINKIKGILILAYKHKIGFEVNYGYDIKNKLNAFSTEVIAFTLTKLNDLQKYIYLNKHNIESKILDILSCNQNRPQKNPIRERKLRGEVA